MNFYSHVIYIPNLKIILIHQWLKKSYIILKFKQTIIKKPILKISSLNIERRWDDVSGIFREKINQTWYVS